MVVIEWRKKIVAEFMHPGAPYTLGSDIGSEARLYNLEAKLRNRFAWTAVNPGEGAAESEDSNVSSDTSEEKM